MNTTTGQWISSLLEKGLKLQEAGKGDEGGIFFRKALHLSPNHPWALFLLGCLEFERDHISHSIALIQSAIKYDPAREEFYLILGSAFNRQGQTAKATGCFKKALALNPSMPAALLNIGLLLIDNEQAGEAVATLKQAHDADPTSIDIQMALGRAYLALGDSKKACRYLEDILRRDPQCVPACFYLGVAYQNEGNLKAALENFQNAVARNPSLAEAHLNIGLIHGRLGDTEAAGRSTALALKAEPEMPEALNNMGNLCMRAGKPQEAVGWYQRAVSHRPEFKDARLNLANCYRKCMDFTNALDHYERFLTEFPDSEAAYFGLGCIYWGLRQSDEAIACFQKALELNPNSITACDNLVVIYNNIGENEKARAYLKRKTGLRPDFVDEVKKAMMLPIIYDSAAAMDACRANFETDLERLWKEKKEIGDPARQVGTTNFILALHGKNERPIREKLARFYLDVCPNLQWTSPWLNTRRAGKKIKIGMISSFFSHTTIGNLYRGLIENLSKSKFDLTLFRLPGKEDDLAAVMDAAAQEVVTLPPDFRKAREILARRSLDVIFYPEIGMDALTYFIAFSRLAPVQCKRGFQITMGIPAIDYFISSDAAEPADAQRYYSERLVRLKGTGYYYYRPKKPAQLLDRASFGLPEGRTLYACAQSLFKLHPDFDSVLAQVLERDPNGTLVLVDGLYSRWKRLLMNRFKKTMPGVYDRICFVPRQPREDFMNLHLLADAVLDTIHFSGGNTSLECFAWGIPVVTWPSMMLPGRLTYGFYKLMGVMDCVAWDQTGYVDIAYRLANDPGWRQEISRKIEQRSSVLFENKADVEELEQFFESAVDSAYKQKREKGKING